jgi:succinyl-CoA synthetase beta subunit
MATMAAIRLRHARPAVALDLREGDNSTVIGDALRVVLTAASISWKHRKQHGFCALAGADPIAAPVKQPYRAAS